MNLLASVTVVAHGLADHFPRWFDPRLMPWVGAACVLAAINAVVTVDRLAWAVVTLHLLFGIGPGYIYRWPTPGGEVKSSPYLDSGLSLLAKFGLTIVPGVALMMLCLWCVVANPRGDAIGRAALLGLGVTAILWMTVEAPLEDKGFGLGLAVLLVLAGARRTAEVTETQPKTSSQDAACEPAMVGAAATC